MNNIVTTYAQRDKIRKALEKTIKDNKPLRNEAVWNYFVSYILATGKKKNKIANMICGEEVILPQSHKVFFEAEPKTSRKKEGNTKLDISFGDISIREKTKSGIQYIRVKDRPSWVCFIEGKLLSDCSNKTLYYPLRNQIARIIENLLKFHDGYGQFPDKLFFTLLTPKKFKSNPYSRLYGYKYKEYKCDKQNIVKDILNEDVNEERSDKEEVEKMLDNNLPKLNINWVTYEEIIKEEYGLELNIVEDNKSNKIDLQQIKELIEFD